MGCWSGEGGSSPRAPPGPRRVLQAPARRALGAGNERPILVPFLPSVCVCVWGGGVLAVDSLPPLSPPELGRGRTPKWPGPRCLARPRGWCRARAAPRSPRPWGEAGEGNPRVLGSIFPGLTSYRGGGRGRPGVAWEPVPMRGRVSGRGLRAGRARAGEGCARVPLRAACLSGWRTPSLARGSSGAQLRLWTFALSAPARRSLSLSRHSLPVPGGPGPKPPGEGPRRPQLRKAHAALCPEFVC